MADSQPTPPPDVAQPASPQPVAGQVTSKTPTTKPATAKNPKRVAAGKASAEKTKLAREVQQKAAAEAAAIIENNEAKKKIPRSSEPQHEAAVLDTRNVLNTTQWLTVISIVVSLVGLYYKREEIKNAVFSKPQPRPEGQDHSRPPDIPQTRRGIRSMD